MEAPRPGRGVARGGEGGRLARFVAWKETVSVGGGGIGARERGNPKVGEASRRQKGRGFGGPAHPPGGRARRSPLRGTGADFSPPGISFSSLQMCTSTQFQGRQGSPVDGIRLGGGREREERFYRFDSPLHRRRR